MISDVTQKLYKVQIIYSIKVSQCKICVRTFLILFKEACKLRKFFRSYRTSICKVYYCYCPHDFFYSFLHEHIFSSFICLYFKLFQVNLKLRSVLSHELLYILHLILWWFSKLISTYRSGLLLSDHLFP